MTTFAITMAKDEAGIIETTVRQMASQVDRVIVSDNLSCDGTRGILDGLAEELPLSIVEDPEPAYNQSEKMSALAAHAAKAGADWVVAFDCDEWWYSPFGRIADVLDEHPAAAIATAQVFDHVATGEDPSGDPAERMRWRRAVACPLQKVACRPALPVTIAMGNHDATYQPTERLDGQLVVRHFPIRSAKQMIAKARNGARAIAATTLPEETCAHWRQWDQLSDEELTNVFHDFYWSADPENDPGLVFDPVCELP